MKTRSAAFDLVWEDRTKQRVWRVELLRRYFNGSAYVLESQPIVLREGDVVDISAITRRIDDTGAMRISNATLKLKNHDQEWLPANTGTGRWAPDAVAALGYDPINSEVRIYAGYVLDDESEEMLPMFTGVIDDEPQFDPSGAAIFTLVSLAEAQMRNANAQKVYVPVDLKAANPAAGDGVNLVFSTEVKSLWYVGIVGAGGVEQVQGDEKDYTLTDLNDADVAPNIKFNTGKAPASGAAVLHDGRRWHRDITPGNAIALLCTQAGIPAERRVVEEPIFNTADQFQDIAAAGWSTIGALLSGGGFEDAADLALWSPLPASGDAVFAVRGSTVGPVAGNGLFLDLFNGDGNAPLSIKAQLIPASGTTIEKTFDVKAVDPQTGTNRRYIMAGAQGPYTVRFIYYWNGVEVGRITSPATTAARAVEFYAAGAFVTGTQATIAFDHVRGIDTVKSPEVDMLAPPGSWLPLSLGNSTIQAQPIRTKVASAAGGPYDAAALVDGNLTPTSALKRYAVIIVTAIEAAMSAPGTTARLNWRGNQLFLKSLDLTGFKNCLEAAAAIAEFTGMDHGGTDDGKYFFRNRIGPGDADMVLNHKNAISGISGYSLGLREVRTKIQVRYGKSGDRGYYFEEYGAAEAGDVAPTQEQRFGERVREIVLDRFLFSNNADVARAIAAKAYAQDSRPKRKGKALGRFIPQLENRDRVELSFHISELIEEQIMGDPLQTDPAIGGATNTLLRDVPVKVKAKTDQIIQGKTVFDWEEILDD